MFLQIAERILSVVGGIQPYTFCRNEPSRSWRMSSSSSTISIVGFTGSRSGLATASPAFIRTSAQPRASSVSRFSSADRLFFLHHFIRLLYHSIQLVERQGYDKGGSLSFFRFLPQPFRDEPPTRFFTMLRPIPVPGLLSRA